MDFSIKEIISIVYKHFVFLVICTLAGFALLFAVSKFMMKPTYTASVQMYVNSGDTAASIDLNDLNYAQKVVNTYINLLQTKVFFQRVLEESGLNYTLDQLSQMTRISTVNNTEIFRISVTAGLAEDAYGLAAAMQRLAPEVIQNIRASAQISVVDPVTMPMAPSGPKVILNTVIGGFAGLILSLAAIFLWEIIDINVKNAEDLKQRYHRPLLGEIPGYEKQKRKRPVISRLILRKSALPEQSSTSEATQKFAVIEAYRALRTNLRYTLNKDGCKIILINSPVPMDGKTTVCANLGIVIAQTGARVLLLDCDLRRGRLHQLFSKKSNPGISEILSGIAGAGELIQSTVHENLDVITMGTIPPNPTELLMGYSMEELVRSQENYYDYILIDSPPVNVVSDVLSLIKLADGMIVVVRENATSHPNITKAMAKYELLGSNILGFVLNGTAAPMGNRSKSHYYSYYKGHE